MTYKQQKSISHGSGDWEIQDQDTGNVMSVKAHFLAYRGHLFVVSSPKEARVWGELSRVSFRK